MSLKDYAIRIGKNIRALRAFHNETLDDLAYALNLEGSISRLSNYENGYRTPDMELLSKIARHYRISEYTLIYRTFPDDISEHNFSITDIRFVSEHPCLAKIFPIVECTSNKSAPELYKATRIHSDLYRFLENKIKDFDGDSIDKISEIYQKFHEDGSLEATVNLAGLILMKGMLLFSLTPSMLLSIEECDSPASAVGNSSSLNFLHLPEFCDTSDEEYKELYLLKRSFIDEYNETLLSCLSKMKSSPEFSELCYYYLALRYVFCLTPGNEEETGEICTTGYEMLCALASVGNKNAEIFLDITCVPKKKEN